LPIACFRQLSGLLTLVTHTRFYPTERIQSKSAQAK
jgi:hypothetical protein